MYIHVRRAGLFQIFRSLITHFEEEGGGNFLHKKADDVIHHTIFRLTGNGGPVKFITQGVQCPEAGAVALGGDNRFGAENVGDVFRHFIGLSDVSREDGNGIAASAVYTDHGGICMFIFHMRGDGADADAHGTYEDKGIVAMKRQSHKFFVKRNICAVGCRSRGDYFGVGKLVTQRSRDGQTAFGNQYNSYLHRVALIILIHKVTFIISIGL